MSKHLVLRPIRINREELPEKDILRLNVGDVVECSSIRGPRGEWAHDKINGIKLPSGFITRMFIARKLDPSPSEGRKAAKVA